jgi:hypothetical protein
MGAVMKMREYTNKLLEMVEEGLLDKDMVIMACVKYMSERDVKDMMEANEMLLDEEDEDEEEWSPYTADYNDKGSIHHY